MVYSYEFICVYIVFHFMLMLLKLEHALITADLLNQKPTKKIKLLYKNVSIRCCKYLSTVLNTIITDKRHFPLSVSLNDIDSKFQRI